MTERQNDDSQVGEGPAGPHRGAQAHGPRSVYFQRPVAPTERLYLAAGRLGPRSCCSCWSKARASPTPAFCARRWPLRPTPAPARAW